MKIFFLTLTIAALLSFVVLGQNETAVKEALKEIFPELQTITTEARTFAGQEVKVYKISAESKLIGWAVVLDEMGKVKPITFLVGIDTQGKVSRINVLEYRDMLGSEIKRRSFLRQFQGKSLEDTLQVGRDIDAVTGATISSQSATVAVRKAICIIAELQKKDSSLKDVTPLDKCY